MQISEIRIKLIGNRTDRLKAFCSVTFDNSFVVRDLKIIEGSGGYFVAMPSRKLMDRCNGCGEKNHLRAKFCNECGARLDEARLRRRGPSGRTKLHADVAHPINTPSREYIQKEVIKAFTRELELSKQPDYNPREMDILDDDYAPEAAAARQSSATSEPHTTTPEPHTGTSEPHTGGEQHQPVTPPGGGPVGTATEQPSPAQPAASVKPKEEGIGFSEGIV